MVGMTRVVLSTLCGILGAIGCDAQTGLDPERLPVALLDEDSGVTTLVFGSADHQADLDDIAEGAKPLTFAWTAVRVPSELRDQLMSPEGINVEMTSAEHAVTFIQVYGDVCNPAANDFSHCYLYESYTAGDEGLSGSLQLTLQGERAVGRFAVVWEGITDRFQGQPQWHRHETSTGFTATLVDER